MSLLRNLRRLVRNSSGVAMTEFALGAPFLLMAGLWGTEEANYALVNMKIGQLAVHVADNASRVGDTSTLQNRRVYESDITALVRSLLQDESISADQRTAWERWRNDPAGLK